MACDKQEDKKCYKCLEIEQSNTYEGPVWDEIGVSLDITTENLSWENKLAMNEWDNLHKKFEKLGERETITSPKEDIKLKGFDESFPEALRLGRESGFIEGSSWVRKQARFKDKYNFQGNAER